MKTVGEVIALLEKVPNLEASVYFDFGHLRPTHIDSWRGIYAEPALGYATTFEPKIPNHTATTLLNELRDAISGREYCGWKGGDFIYDETMPLHIDNRGECSNTEIADVVGDKYVVTIKTEQRDAP